MSYLSPGGDFDYELERYQYREQELARRRAEVADRKARRPQAVPRRVRFDEVREGDFISAEPERGPEARWVEVVKIEPGNWKTGEEDGSLTLTFRTPEPLGVAYTDRWVIVRRAEETTAVDESARG